MVQYEYSNTCVHVCSGADLFYEILINGISRDWVFCAIVSSYNSDSQVTIIDWSAYMKWTSGGCLLVSIIPTHFTYQLEGWMGTRILVLVFEKKHSIHTMYLHYKTSPSVRSNQPVTPLNLHVLYYNNVQFISYRERARTFFRLLGSATDRPNL